MPAVSPIALMKSSTGERERERRGGGGKPEKVIQTLSLEKKRGKRKNRLSHLAFPEGARARLFRKKKSREGGNKIRNLNSNLGGEKKGRGGV